MKRARIVLLGAASLGLLLAQACSGDDSTQTDGGSDASLDTTQDVAKQDSSTNDAAQDSSTNDAGDAGCPSSWTVEPTVEPSLAIPDGGGGVLLHAAASGTQDYTCTATTTDAGTTYAWLFIGPEADLHDCAQKLIGHHFANDAGSPEWQTTDQAFVVGKKLAAFTPDGGASSVPWLMLQSIANGGTSELGKTSYVQRLDTDGGIAPSATCDGQNAGTTMKEPYTADYWFYGN